jgi:hypothetical protein
MSTHAAAAMIEHVEEVADQAAALAPYAFPAALARTIHGSRSYTDAVDALTDYDPREDGV